MVAVSQPYLFPDDAQVRDRVADALRRLDVSAGRAHLSEARSCAPDLAGLDALEQGVAWLGRALDDGFANVESAARAWLALSGTRLEGGLDPTAVELVDRALSEYLLRNAPRGERFVDAARRVPRGALHLVLENFRNAYDELTALRPADLRRADLSAWLADACLHHGVEDGVGPNYVRALVFDPDGVDYGRIAHRGLSELLRTALRTLPADAARAALLADAWIDGLLDVAPGDLWPGEAVVESLLAATGSTTERDRLRRFSLLLFRDRTRPPAMLEPDAREEMRNLSPDRFSRFLAACANRSRAKTGLLRW